MKKQKNNNKKNLKRILLILIGIIIICTVIVFVYINDYYKADKENINAYLELSEVTKIKVEKDIIVYGEKTDKIGYIFYPGGKVEYTSYEPLLKNIASHGITTILIKMPANLAILNTNAANGIQEQFPNIKSWYIGGHSLGGSAAAMHISKNIEKYEGMILLGSYSTKDLSNTNLRVLSLVGSEDKIVDMEKYNNNYNLLPKETQNIVIEGANHAYYGMYGKQDGDGEALITNEEQINIATNKIVEFLTN